MKRVHEAAHVRRVIECSEGRDRDGERDLDRPARCDAGEHREAGRSRGRAPPSVERGDPLRERNEVGYPIGS
jgi:hypothetical protein